MRIEQIRLYKRHNYLPERFIWRGMAHTIARIEQIWSANGRRSTPSRHYFRVRCGDNRVYKIFQDIRLNAWYVER